MGLFHNSLAFKMVYNRFVETGRVALVQSSDNSGKLVAILDVIDQQRVLVDGPNATRGAALIKNLRLTDLSVKVTRTAKKAGVAKAFVDAEIDAKWSKSKWSQRRAIRAQRRTLTDFERFQVMMAKKQRSKIVSTHVNKA